MTSPVRVGINGFGRIGRATLRTALGREGVEVVAINDVMDPADVAYLAEYDTVWGTLDPDVSIEDGDLAVGDRRIALSSEPAPADLPWEECDVDVAVESTGLFRTRDDAAGHLAAGADAVVISAPPKGDDDVPQFVYGVNHDDYAGERVVSGASCTTNSVTPPLSVALAEYTLEAADMTTIHAYTGSQELVDGPTEKTRRGRAAAENIVPTTTGAATAAPEILPALEGRFEATAIRVPVPSGSITELTLDLAEDPSAEAVNDVLAEYADGPLADAMGVTEDPVVSSDVVGTEYGSVVDLPQTTAVGDGIVQVFAWYDNEVGYSSQLLHLVERVGTAR
ncbi:MAG: type I glyceraldehyde-3-phosphate dehydrogenase [Halanaeroarchaeum sp.]